MKRTVLLLLLAVCCLLLTACYTENDPWPDANLNNTPTPAPAVTIVPATDAPQPALTPEPLPEDAVDISPSLNG